MSRVVRHQQELQMELFVPPRQTLRWQQVPTGVQQRIVRLLAQMLCEYRTASALEERREVSDE